MRPRTSGGGRRGIGPGGRGKNQRHDQKREHRPSGSGGLVRSSGRTWGMGRVSELELQMLCLFVMFLVFRLATAADDTGADELLRVIAGWVLLVLV